MCAQQYSPKHFDLSSISQLSQLNTELVATQSGESDDEGAKSYLAKENATKVVALYKTLLGRS